MRELIRNFSKVLCTHSKGEHCKQQARQAKDFLVGASYRQLSLMKCNGIERNRENFCKTVEATPAPEVRGEHCIVVTEVTVLSESTTVLRGMESCARFIRIS